MNLFFLLFVLFALLLIGNAVRSFIGAAKGQNRTAAIANGVVSIVVAVIAVLVGHYMFNF